MVIMIIAVIYIFLSSVIFDQQLKITFRKSLAPSPWKNHSPLFTHSLPPPKKNQKVQVPPFCQHWKFFRPPLQRARFLYDCIYYNDVICCWSVFLSCSLHIGHVALHYLVLVLLYNFICFGHYICYENTSLAFLIFFSFDLLSLCSDFIPSLSIVTASVLLSQLCWILLLGFIISSPSFSHSAFHLDLSSYLFFFILKIAFFFAVFYFSSFTV